MAVARLHLAEHLVYVGKQGRLHRVAEVPEDGGLSEGAGRAQAGDPEAGLQGPAGGHDLPSQLGQSLVRQGALVQAPDPFQDLGLPLGPVIRGFILSPFELGGLQRQPSAPVQQLDQLLVQRVYLAPEGRQLVITHGIVTIDCSAFSRGGRRNPP